MNQELRSKLDRLTNILFAGGVNNPVTYIEQLSYLIYLKLLDEEENNRLLQTRLTGSTGNGKSRLLFPAQAERYRWSKWRFKSGKRANSLSDMGGLTDDDLRRKYKVILSNPPFSGTLPRESIRKDLPTNSKKSELLFLGVMMEALAPGGRCAVVVPEGLLFGSTTAHVELRRKLCEQFELLAIISLPAGVFKPYAGVKTGVVVFRRPAAGSPVRSRPVWFYEIRNDGYDPDKITGGGRPETPDRNDIPALLAHWKDYKASQFEKAPGVEAGTLLPSGTDECRSWWAKQETIAENDYNLAAGRYKPQVAEKPPEEEPTELIRHVLATEREIADGLEKLLKEVENAG